MCGKNNSYRHLHQPSTIFHRWFLTPLVFRELRFKNRAKVQKAKTIVHSIDVCALICSRPRAAWDPISEIHCPNWGPKVRQFKKGYIALTQPHVDRLRSNFTRWYPAAAWKMRNCQNLASVESKMADDVQIFNIWTPISLKRLNLEISNLVCASTTMSSFHGMQNTTSKGT